MRTVVFALTVVFTTIYYAGGLVVLAFLGRRTAPGNLFEEAPRRWGRAVLRAAGTPVEVRHEEKVPPGPVIFLSTHASFFDVWALVATIRRSIRFVAKKELSRIPVLGRAIRAAEHIFIDRQNRQAAFEAYEVAAAAIRAGSSAVVFPEGTRSRTGDIQPFKKGPFVLAIAAQVPIVPVYVANSFDIMPKGQFRIRPKPLIVHYSDPIPTAGLDYGDRDALAVQVRDVLVDLKARVDAEIANPIGSARHE